jgi:NAD(P)-dependent dehydrogenase (short-subunit alcohol dehydrogenase family)
MSNKNWNTQNIPDQKGKVIIITGATSGLGKEAAKVFAAKGASLILPVRNTEKAKAVAEEIMKTTTNAKIDIRSLDLSSLNSIKIFSDEISKSYNQLDILINNAGIMYCPYSKTQDGFEMQMGTNHFGPYALTAQLMPLLMKTSKSRIVNTASLAHLTGNIDFDDINWENRKYKTMQAYADSKIANLYFHFELVKKLKGQKNVPLVIAAHPGWTKTELDRHIGIVGLISTIIGQKVEMGVLPTLRAAIDPDAISGDYFGPDGFREMRGYPIKVKANAMALNVQKAEQLWTLSEKLPGIKYYL